MKGTSIKPDLKRIALVGTCVPRQCGIATFTDDLHRALMQTDPAMATMTIAVTDEDRIYAYPQHVPIEVHQSDRQSYAVAADFLNVADVEVVSLQHEFGIFGGDAGDHVLELLRRLKAPIVTTLHTVLAQPDDGQRRVMNALIHDSAQLVVMAEKGREILRHVYEVPDTQIAVIPHGVHDRPFLDPAMAKLNLGLGDHTLLMTFGLLGPGKGIETTIRALPALVRSHPKLTYMVVGATHPNLLRNEGERYRNGLLALAAELGVSNNLRFVNRYLSLEELLDHLTACDVYVSPYPHEAQITSGTLAYAIALGKAVVSTPFWHAQELLSDGCGTLVPFGDSEALASAIAGLVNDPALRGAIRTHAYARGRNMIWSKVARQYLEIFSKVRFEHRNVGATMISFPTTTGSPSGLPPVSTTHLAALTDSVGLIQHTKFAVPDRRHGYCLDDNARGLLVMNELAQLRPLTQRESQMAMTYATFVEHAWSVETGTVHNFMGFDRCWRGAAGKDDAHGRAVWALGSVARSKDPRDLDSWAAARLLEMAPSLTFSTSPRAWAYGLLGISGFLTRFPGHRAFEQLRTELAGRLLQRWRDASQPTWNWFEDRLGYDNARLCEALMVSGNATGNVEQFEVGTDALRWLMSLQTAPQGHFRPVGTQTFHSQDQRFELFDQQPLEAWAAVSACQTAARLTKDLWWQAQAARAFAWFLGSNDLGIPIADIARGACFDGLHPDRRNANQGAESTLAYLAALTAMQLVTASAAPERGDVVPSVCECDLLPIAGSRNSKGPVACWPSTRATTQIQSHAKLAGLR